MGLLAGKNALIFGVANKDSIAWGITQAFHREGAHIGLSYAIDKLERRVKPMAESLGIDFVERADANNDDELDAVFAKAKDQFGTVDILVHAIAYAQREDLGGGYIDTTREGFKVSLETSVYSLVALAQRAVPMMPNGGSIITLTYFGAEKVMPHYNIMGVSKAALEASTRYLAADLGPQGIRVNAISAGAIKTLSSSAISGSRKLFRYVAGSSPLRALASQDDVGNAALWLASDWGKMVTGETLHVDAGYNIMGVHTLPEQVES